MTRRSIAIALSLLLAPAALPTAYGAAGDPASAFIVALGTRALDVLGAEVPPGVRQARFRELYRQNFDTPRIARFVLGRYWNLASEAQRQDFMRLFEDYVVIAYSARLSGLSGERFLVEGSRVDGGAIVVSSEVVRPNTEHPLKVDWRLVDEYGRLKIADVIVEGISMAVTQRSEFAAVIQRNGGQVNGLLTVMREKTAAVH